MGCGSSKASAALSAGETQGRTGTRKGSQHRPHLPIIIEHAEEHEERTTGKEVAVEVAAVIADGGKAEAPEVDGNAQGQVQPLERPADQEEAQQQQQ
eukprot:m.171459 g.171459  ORF g.171459 m.171459 type:complete len:97 (-) comp16501_c0_seq1:5-295(-)